MADQDAFEGADYYECRDDAEELMHESAVEAIADLLDCWVTPLCDRVAVIEEQSPITVTAYRRAQIPAEEFTALALHAADGILESLDDEYNPEGCEAGTLCEHERSLGDALEPVLRAWCEANYQVWVCRPSAKRVYAAAEVEALMRQHEPSWFEEPKSTLRSSKPRRR